MKLRFHLRNDGDRDFRITVLDKTLLLARKGTRGSHAVVELDEFRFRYQGEADKFFEPYLAAGLRISLETDIPIHDSQPAPSAAPAVRRHVPGSVLPNSGGVGDSAQRVRTINEGEVGVSVLGHLDLGGEKIRTIDQSGGRGDTVFASGSQSVDLDMEEPLRTKRMPHSGDERKQSPPDDLTVGRPTIAEPLSEIPKKAAGKSGGASGGAVLKKASKAAAGKSTESAEKDGGINLASLIDDMIEPPPDAKIADSKGPATKSKPAARKSATRKSAKSGTKTKAPAAKAPKAPKEGVLSL